MPIRRGKAPKALMATRFATKKVFENSKSKIKKVKTAAGIRQKSKKVKNAAGICQKMKNVKTAAGIRQKMKNVKTVAGIRQQKMKRLKPLQASFKN